MIYIYGYFEMVTTIGLWSDVISSGIVRRDATAFARTTPTTVERHLNVTFPIFVRASVKTRPNKLHQRRFTRLVGSEKDVQTGRDFRERQILPYAETLDFKRRNSHEPISFSSIFF